MKIRIAVAIDREGKWNSCGFSDGDDDDMMNLAVESIADGEARYWIEAEIDEPGEPITVQAIVETAPATKG